MEAGIVLIAFSPHLFGKERQKVGTPHAPAGEDPCTPFPEQLLCLCIMVLSFQGEIFLMLSIWKQTKQRLTITPGSSCQGRSIHGLLLAINFVGDGDQSPTRKATRNIFS